MTTKLITLDNIGSMPFSAGYKVYFKHVGAYQFKIRIEFSQINKAFESVNTWRSRKILKHTFMFNTYRLSGEQFVEVSL